MNDLQTNLIATRPCDATTILRQIGTLTLMACGARRYLDLGDGVHFNVGAGNRTKIVVKLAADDTYAVEHVKMTRDLSARSLEYADSVYCDQLADVVYRMVNK